MIEPQYKIDLDFCPTPILLVASTGGIARTNRRLDELFWYEPGELVGLSVETLVPESSRANHPNLRGAYFENPSPRRMGTGRDLYGVRKDGELIPVEVGLDPIEFDGEQMVMASVVDIRERKFSEANLRRAINAAASAVIQVGESGEIELVNDHAVRLFGYTSEELQGMNVDELVPIRSRKHHAIYRENYQSAHVPRLMGDGRALHGLRKDGTEFPIEIALTPMADLSGKSTMATIIDVTEHGARLRVANEHLRAANKELLQFAHSVSHDLKAPLTSIQGLLEICEQDLRSGDLEEVLTNVGQSKELTTKLARRIESLLALARADEHEASTATLDVGQLIQQQWEAIAPAGVELDTSLTHEEPFRCVEPRFVVILSNLLSNAVKFRNLEARRSWVRVSTRSESGQFVMVVADNGIGIDEQFRHRLFGAFQRFSNQSAGSGLGLALVKKHVVALRGRVALLSTSKSGEGAAFEVALPQPFSAQLEETV